MPTRTSADAGTSPGRRGATAGATPLELIDHALPLPTDRPGDVKRRVPLCNRLPAIALASASGESELDLGSPRLEIDAERNHGEPLLRDPCRQLLDLAGVEQE